MKFVEFINFGDQELKVIRLQFRESDSLERWVEWRVGLKAVVAEPDISLINLRGISDPWKVKMLSDMCSGRYAAIYGVAVEILGLPFVSEHDLINSLSALLRGERLSSASADWFGEGDLTCPMPLGTRTSNWGELSSKRSIPLYA